MPEASSALGASTRRTLGLALAALAIYAYLAVYEDQWGPDHGASTELNRGSIQSLEWVRVEVPRDGKLVEAFRIFSQTRPMDPWREGIPPETPPGKAPLEPRFWIVETPEGRFDAAPGATEQLLLRLGHLDAAHLIQKPWSVTQGPQPSPKDAGFDPGRLRVHWKQGVPARELSFTLGEDSPVSQLRYLFFAPEKALYTVEKSQTYFLKGDPQDYIDSAWFPPMDPRILEELVWTGDTGSPVRFRAPPADSNQAWTGPFPLANDAVRAFLKALARSPTYKRFETAHEAANWFESRSGQGSSPIRETSMRWVSSRQGLSPLELRIWTQPGAGGVRMQLRREDGPDAEVFLGEEVLGSLPKLFSQSEAGPSPSPEATGTPSP